MSEAIHVSDDKGSTVVSQFNFKCHGGSFEVHWNMFWPKSIHNQNFQFLIYLIYRSQWAMQKFRTNRTWGSRIFFFQKLLFWFVVSSPFNGLEAAKKTKSKFSNLSPLPTQRYEVPISIVAVNCTEEDEGTYKHKNIDLWSTHFETTTKEWWRHINQ